MISTKLTFYFEKKLVQTTPYVYGVIWDCIKMVADHFTADRSFVNRSQQTVNWSQQRSFHSVLVRLGICQYERKYAALIKNICQFLALWSSTRTFYNIRYCRLNKTSVTDCNISSRLIWTILLLPIFYKVASFTKRLWFLYSNESRAIIFH